MTDKKTDTQKPSERIKEIEDRLRGKWTGPVGIVSDEWITESAIIKYLDELDERLRRLEEK